MQRLTKHPPASIREVVYLSSSFIVVLLSTSLMGLCDRLILARYSLEAVEASISALYLIQLFQIPCIIIASTAQIFVGHHKGTGELSAIGPTIWQMIWFALFSMLLIGPLSPLVCESFFENTSIQGSGTEYFSCLIIFNFLFPLSVALASFYLGRGQTRRVLLTSLLCHGLHILLDFPLIFGVSGWFQPLGVRGAAISAVMSQFIFCLILFRDFFKPAHRHLYATDHYALQFPLLWKCLKIGLPRAASKLVILLAWTTVTHLILHKEGDYLAVLAFGGTLNLFYTCFNEGLSQALTTIGAYLVGARNFLIWKLARSSLVVLSTTSAALSIPLLFFPEIAISLFFKQEPSPLLHTELTLSCYWLWLLFTTHGLNLIGLGLLNAYGDTLFQMIFSTSLAWIASFFPVYYFIGKNSAAPHNLWLIHALGCLTYAGVYLLRLRQEKWVQSYPLFPAQTD